jgi:hypothetical protein
LQRIYEEVLSNEEVRIMRKIMLLAAVMAMVLAAAAPAFAQANAVGGSVQYVDCDQIQAAVTGQYNTDNEQDLAGIAQELGVSQNQVLACVGSIAAGEDVNINTATAGPKTATASAAAATPTATAPAGDKTKIAPAKVQDRKVHGRKVHGRSVMLPETGGASLIALGAGALLVAGGVVARRTYR